MPARGDAPPYPPLRCSGPQGEPLHLRPEPAAWRRILAVLSAVFCAAPGTGRAQVAAGFSEVASAPGCVLYQKDYAGGKPDFVVVVDLTKAQVRSFVGPVASPGTGAGPLGGDDPTITRQPLAAFWSQVKTAHPAAFAVVNGQFFSTAADPTPLAFSVKAQGSVMSDGYGIKSEYPGQIRLFRANNGLGFAGVVDFSKEALHEGSAPEAVAGLDVAADKGPGSFTGRTFVGVRDANGDGVTEQVLVFASGLSSQPGAAEVLAAFGAKVQAMLDGGASTQLIVQGASKVTSARTIPHVLAVIAEKATMPEPILVIATSTSAADIYAEGPSLGVADVHEGEIFTGDVLVTAQASGGSTNGHVIVDYSIPAPWLVPVSWAIYSDWPHLDKKTWSPCDADSDPANPPKEGMPASGSFDVHSLWSGETRRIAMALEASQYSIGEVQNATITAAIQGGPAAARPIDVYGGSHWEWNGEKEQLEGWKAGGGIAELLVDTAQHALAVHQGGADPWVASPELLLTAEEWGGFELRVRHGEGQKSGQLHWTTSKDSAWTGGKSTWFLSEGNGDFHVVKVSTAGNPEWKGTITGLRLDPTTGPFAWYYIDWLRAVKGPVVTTGDADGDGSLAGADCDDTAPAVHPGAAEVCDGVDNDCDGDADEGFDVGKACTAGQGECASAGVVVCASGGGSSCGASPKAPEDESCNAKDDDCDGQTDEDFGLGEPCERQKGACKTMGVLVCAQSGAAYCDAPDPAQSEEICNQQDDDCDSQTDEGFGVGEPCSQGIGPCSTDGFVSCTPEGGTFCKAPAPEGKAEICNEVDDDCDGKTDEGFQKGEPCTAWIAPDCPVDGVLACDPTGLEVVCEPSSDACGAPGDDAGGGVADAGPGTAGDGGDPGALDPAAAGEGSDGCSGGSRPLGPGGLLILLAMWAILLRRCRSCPG